MELRSSDHVCQTVPYNETEAKRFLNYYEQTANTVLKEFVEATWNYVTNITKPNREEMLQKELETSQFMKYFSTRAHLFNITQIQDPTVKRMLSKLKETGKAALPYEELWEYNKLVAYMETAYNLAKVCLDERPCMILEPDLQEVMATSRDHRELLWAWEGWRDSVGRQLRPIFWQCVELSNKAAQLNGYKDMGQLWRAKYESDTLEQDLEQIYQELQPLYLNLHAYVRRALYRHYGPELISLRGPIPAHLLGDMWAQSWNNILDMVLPFPKKPPVDITHMMKRQHWRSEKMFEEADKLFTSLGMVSVPSDFWKKSMLERPTDGRSVECQASAWDFYTGNDFRVKKCTEGALEDMLSVFHLMGHIQYFMQYQNLSVIFREGANPAFEEAVGTMVTLSSSSHRHLFSTGLISLWQQDSEEEVNYLMSMALEKIAFIPFSYIMDLFRWKVFDGTIEKNIYNQEWWNLRLKYQGLCPPVPRTEDDFDPAAKFHVPANVPCTRYFIRTVLQFQLHEALCNASGYVGPLHQCDIYGSKTAGRILGNALKLGSSKLWPEVQKELTGQSVISTSAIMTYFKPLLNWLVAENVRQGEILGWPDYTCFFSERSTNKVALLGLQMKHDQVIFVLSILVGVSFVLLLVLLGLAYRLYFLKRWSGDQDTLIFSTLPYTYFLGVRMEPRKATRRQWILLGIFLILLLRTISLTIWISTHNRKMSSQMRAD
nr:angiotensin-converting enzyme-like protein Ace3 [Cavia porcellus]